MKFIPCLVLGVLAAACGPLRHPIRVSDETDEIHVSRLSRISVVTVQQIADARGGKEEGEIWHVDRSRADVRIRKSRDGSDPDDDVELWFRDADGSWMQRH